MSSVSSALLEVGSASLASSRVRWGPALTRRGGGRVAGLSRRNRCWRHSTPSGRGLPAERRWSIILFRSMVWASWHINKKSEVGDLLAVPEAGPWALTEDCRAC
ncbi:unnamed protein product [Prorocentrum cordatum]|uniref:Uncharacterized protein n=1 Tax=Prorocentrum cordatum TaxID=2364126 RepID=A0ABN9PXM7_9DINO|nr:unnamed protein product [Polarella glacialis]